MHSPEAIDLVFNSDLFKVAGEVLEGEVLLNFPTLQLDKVEEVYVKLEGTISTRITRSRGNTSNTSRQTVHLYDQKIPVWSRGTAYPPPDTHILTIPFRFTLPSKLPPSCEFDTLDRGGRVEYSIQVVGVRPGKFQINRRILRPFVVVPPHPKGAAVGQALRAGWAGGWRSIMETKPVRRGIWGEYSNVKWTITVPNIDVFPILTPIPFTITVVTMTRPMKRSEDTVQKDEPIFPAPPRTVQGIEFKLQRNIHIKAMLDEIGSKGVFVAHLGGFDVKARSSDTPTTPVEVEVMDNVWIPAALGNEKDQRGSWKQEVNFRSSFTLKCPPAFSMTTMTVHVDFPGIGNNLRGQFPLRIVSNLQAPGDGVPWDGPPPILDIPP
ncbi:hypothetical protein PHLCEN_2v13604 [Hermanssonia centrifuga]|uniref:Arrestin-like N-terminal domain-containing protein n=1 Tax=Hermanssonia centrifuga TaxID=98765 RepID=A0A2R6NDY1_9APHY|nr:hypothetical protein PHLCEN_2v13604 [Hermanssonia centrifuga]